MIRTWGLGFAFLATLSACGASPKATSSLREAWGPDSDPSTFGASSVPFQQLPTGAWLPTAQIAWSGYYWPTFQGGIADRWQLVNSSSNYKDYVYTPFSAAQTQALTPTQLARLSPAEKYDLLRGATDFPLTKLQLRTTLASVDNGDVPHWYGICHGWAAAAQAEPQPGSVAHYQLPDGRDLPFYTADLEALQSQVYADLTQYQVELIGTRCDQANPTLDPYGRISGANCKGTNPGAFHLVLAEFIGQRQTPFIANVSYNNQVWNQPVAGYASAFSNYRNFDSSDPRAQFRAPGTAYLVDVTTSLYYVTEIAPPTSPTQSQLAQVNFQYSLELDSQNRIIGGEWTTLSRPGFLWRPVSQPVMSSTSLVDLATVRSLVSQSLGGTQPANPNPTRPTTPANPHGDALVFSNWQVTPGGLLHRANIEINGTLTLAQPATIQLLLVRDNGVTELWDTQQVLPGSPFVLQATFAMAFHKAAIVKVIDASGQEVGSFRQDF